MLYYVSRTLCHSASSDIRTGFIFGGAFFGFILARLQFLNFGILCGSSPVSSAAPGECYWYETFTRYHIGIILHLGGILPAGLLVVLQFTPVIRRTFVLYHRIAGYIILTLVVVSDVGALMIADHAFGGDNATQAFVGFLVIVTTISLIFAIINIKKLQIEEHRAWMLRAWFYFGSIITIRIIQFVAAAIGSISGPRYTTMNCAELDFLLKNTTQLYNDFPACNPINSQFAPDGFVTVKSSMAAGLPGVTASIRVNFGMAGWLALVIHAIGIEIYLRLTPRESERLRKLSYQRQLEAGMGNPGSAGLVKEKFGDSDAWVTPQTRPNIDERVSDGLKPNNEAAGDITVVS